MLFFISIHQITLEKEIYLGFHTNIKQYNMDNNINSKYTIYYY